MCWIIPFRKEATFVPGYQGLLALAWRSRQVADTYAFCVYEGDDFDCGLGTQPFIHHKPCGEDDPDKITHAYAVLHTTTGGMIPEVRTRAQIERVRSRAPSAKAKSSPWITDYDDMCRKTVFKRVCKIGPRTTELGRAVALDDLAEIGKPQGLVAPIVVDVPRGTSPDEAQDGPESTISEGPVPEPSAPEEGFEEPKSTPPQPGELDEHGNCLACGRGAHALKASHGEPCKSAGIK